MNSVPEKWRWVTFQRPGALTVELMTGLPKPYAVEQSGVHMSLRDARNPKNPDSSLLPPDASFQVTNPSKDVLVLEGDMSGKSVRSKLVKTPLSSDIHWILVPPKEE